MINRVQQNLNYANKTSFEGGRVYINKDFLWEFGNYIEKSGQKNFGIIPQHLFQNGKFDVHQVTKALRALIQNSNEFKGRYVLGNFKVKDGHASAEMRHYIRKDKYTVEDIPYRFEVNPTHLLKASSDNPKVPNLSSFVSDYVDYVEDVGGKEAVVQKHMKDAWA